MCTSLRSTAFTIRKFPSNRLRFSIPLNVTAYYQNAAITRCTSAAAPEEEMTVAWELLRALGLRRRGPEIISCPTCGRTEIDLIGLAQEVERRLSTETAPIKVAVMGCVVNGPGEAREADLGMAGGRDKGIIFRKGEVIRSVRGQEALLAAFMEELDKLLAERQGL